MSPLVGLWDAINPTAHGALRRKVNASCAAYAAARSSHTCCEVSAAVEIDSSCGGVK